MYLNVHLISGCYMIAVKLLTQHQPAAFITKTAAESGA